MTIKDFFRPTKNKLYVTIGLLVFSLVLGFMAIEAHLRFLNPIYTYFFNWAKLLNLDRIQGIAGIMLVLAVWFLQLYLYSCLILFIKSKKELFRPTLPKIAIALGIFIVINAILLIAQGGCPERALRCTKENSMTSGETYVSGGEEFDRELYSEKAMSVPFTCRQVCYKNQYYEAFSEEIIVKRILLPLLVGYLIASLTVYYRNKRK